MAQGVRQMVFYDNNQKPIVYDLSPDLSAISETSDLKIMTSAERTKLSGIATGANKYTHPGYTARAAGLYKVTVDASGHVNNVTAVTKADITALGIPGQDTNTTYTVATTSANGLMSKDDKTKLDGVATGANNYTHPTYTAKASGLYKVTVDGTGHVSSVAAVTKADITALGVPSINTTYDIATTTANGLMSKEDKTKLDGVATGANKYTHPGYTARAAGLYKVTVDSSGHVNNVAAVTKADITALGIPGQDTNTTYNVFGAATASANGSNGLVPAPASGKHTSFLRGDGTWVVPTNTTYNVATTTANGLMSSADKTKLDGVATGANKYTHPAYTARTAGLYKVTVDASGHVNNVAAVTKADITALGIPGQDTNTTYAVATTTANGLMSSADKTKLDGVATGANKYTHPANHPISMITETDSLKIMTSAERTKLGRFTDTQAQYLNSITSNVQNQINSKKTDEYILVGSDLESSKGWYKVISGSFGSTIHANSTFMFNVTDTSSSRFGKLYLNMRSNAGSIACNKLSWLTVDGFSVSNFIVVIDGFNWAMYHYVDRDRYYRTIFNIIYKTNTSSTTSVSYTTHSNIVKETTTPVATVTSTIGGIVATAYKDSAGQNISSTYVKSITNSGSVVTITKGNGSTSTITLPNTTYGVATTSANGLMSSADKTKLDGVATGANKYTHPGYTARTAGLYKVTVDASGHVNNVTAVTKADITALGIPGQDTNTTYTVATTSANGLMSKEDKTKLDGVATGANNYTHPGYTARTAGLYKVTVDASGHVNNVAAVTKADITALGIPAQDTNTTYSVATTSANGLMSSADKTKLDGVATGANKYTHPAYTAKASGLYKVTVDASGHVSAATAVTKADITALGIPAQDTNTTYSVATTSANGLMSSADKTKLDALPTKATMDSSYVAKSSKVNVTITAASWTGTAAPYSATVSISGVTATNNVEIMVNIDLATLDQVNAWAGSMVMGGTQAANSVTLKAYGEKPTVDIPITAIVRKDI